MRITVNADNMMVSATHVIREFQLLNGAFHLTVGEVQQLLENSINASFASASLKEDLRAKVQTAIRSIR